MRGLIKGLYAYRGEIGALTFFLLYPFFSPKISLLPWALTLVSLGLLIRFWARGYIGRESETRDMKIKEMINSGIYKIRHPLYLGNFFLTLGVLFYSNPPSYLFSLTLSLFLIQYLSFIYLEEKLKKEEGRVNSKSNWSARKALLEIKTVFIVLFIFFFLSLKTWKGF